MSRRNRRVRTTTYELRGSGDRDFNRRETIDSLRELGLLEVSFTSLVVESITWEPKLGRIAIVWSGPPSDVEALHNAYHDAIEE